MGASRDQCTGAAAMLFNAGLLKDKRAETFSTVNKLLYEFLHGDYIPKTTFRCGSVKDMVNIRLAGPGIRCPRQTGDDYPQSGPIYCGDPAFVVADSAEHSGGCYIMCKRHWKQHGLPDPTSTEIKATA